MSAPATSTATAVFGYLFKILETLCQKMGEGFTIIVDSERADGIAVYAIMGPGDGGEQTVVRLIFHNDGTATYQTIGQDAEPTQDTWKAVVEWLMEWFQAEIDRLPEPYQGSAGRYWPNVLAAMATVQSSLM